MTNQKTFHLNAFETTLSGSMNSTTTSAVLTDPGALAAPCWLVIDKDDPAKREYVAVSAVAGSTLTVTRYQSGSAALSGITHDAGATVHLTATKQSFDDLHDRLETHNHSNTGTPNSGAKLDHGAALTGLGDDDHTIYVKADGTRAMTGALDMGGNNITSPGTVAGLTLSQLAPPGILSMFAGAAAPDGWLLCDGSAISRATYSALYAIVGDVYGAGDGSTTFNLPDMRQKFPLGVAASGTGNTLGGTGGAIDHTHTQPTHTHTGPSHTHNVDIASTTSSSNGSHDHPVGGAVISGSGATFGNSGAVSEHTHATVSDGAHTHTVNPASTASTASGTGATGAGGADDTGASNPPFLALNYIIKT